MAVVKDFETRFGVIAKYHKLIKAEVNAEKNHIEIIMGVYASEEARQQGSAHLWVEYVRIPFDRLNFDPRDIFYPLLKNYDQSYLVGATDNILPDGTIHPPVFEVVEPVPPPPPILPPGF